LLLLRAGVRGHAVSGQAITGHAIQCRALAPAAATSITIVHRRL
jgi:hypothetical protein